MKMIIFHGCSFVLQITVFILVTFIYINHQLRVFLIPWTACFSLYEIIMIFIYSKKLIKK